MSTNLRILVDLDGVVADWTDGIIRGLEQRGIDPSVLDLTRWDLTEDETVRTTIREIQSGPAFYESLQPIPGARDALMALEDQGHDVFLCSTPDPLNWWCASSKISWVEDWLGAEWGKRVILTHDKGAVRGDILIDDKPEIRSAMAPEWRRVIFDQTYNREVAGARLHSWLMTDVNLAIWEAIVRG